MESTEVFLPLKDIVERTGIPENSCKRYIEVHEDFINYHKVHNRFRIHVSAIETLKQIRQLYADGYKKEAVDEHLRSSGSPVIITAESEEEFEKFMDAKESVDQLKELFVRFLEHQQEKDKETAEKLELLHNEIVDLKRESNEREAKRIAELKSTLLGYDEKHEELKKGIEESNGVLLETIKEGNEVLGRRMDRPKSEEKKGLWKRLFG